MSHFCLIMWTMWRLTLLPLSNSDIKREWKEERKSPSTWHSFKYESERIRDRRWVWTKFSVRSETARHVKGIKKHYFSCRSKMLHLFKPGPEITAEITPWTLMGFFFQCRVDTHWPNAFGPNAGGEFVSVIWQPWWIGEQKRNAWKILSEWKLQFQNKTLTYEQITPYNTLERWITLWWLTFGFNPWFTARDKLINMMNLIRM